MGHAAQKPVFTAAKYLVWEAEQAGRHEFVDGEVFAMAGAEDRHVTVALNLAFALRQHLAGGPCRTYMSDMKLNVAAAIGFGGVGISGPGPLGMLIPGFAPIGCQKTARQGSPGREADASLLAIRVHVAFFFAPTQVGQILHGNKLCPAVTTQVTLVYEIPYESITYDGPRF